MTTGARRVAAGPTGHAEPVAEEQQAQVVVVGPDGVVRSVEPEQDGGPAQDGDGDPAERPAVAGMISEPAKVMRIGSMVKQLLEEVRAAPLDEAGRAHLAEVQTRAVAELSDGLTDELTAELRRLTLPLGDDADGPPTEPELRIAQAQLVGWLEGVFHGVQTTLVAQQVAARGQLAAGGRALPPGAQPGVPGQQPPAGPAPGQYL